MKITCEARWLGRVDYDDAWQIQVCLAENIARGVSPPTLLLLEHPHVFTIGRQGSEAHILWNATERDRYGIQIRTVDRSGDITYHGPGQLVGYPILPLGIPSKKNGHIPQANFVGYVRKLEIMLMTILIQAGIPACLQPGLTGVWVDRGASLPPAKIASIGIKVDSKGITRHGFALNVNPDMQFWQGIVPCGLEGVVMTSMAEWIKSPPTVYETACRVVHTFKTIFDFSMSDSKPIIPLVLMPDPPRPGSHQFPG